MAKELPYFRFTAAEWLNGDISLEATYLKGIFIDICSYYWFKDCSVTKAMLEKKYNNDVDGINDLIRLDILKHDGETDFLCINFLNEQYDILSEQRKRRQEAGSKGGKQKSSNAKAELKQKPSYKDKYKEKDNNKDKESEVLVLNGSQEKAIEFISEKFGITEMKHFLNYKTIHDCVVCQFTQGEELFNHFKDQIWNYFMYKEKAKEKLHSFKGFIGSPEEKFIDGGWNAENWNKKHIGLEQGEVNNGVEPKEDNKNKVDYSWNKKRNYKEKDLTKIKKP